MVTSYTSRLVAGREPGSESSEEEAVPGWEDLGQIDGGPALTLELLPWESGLILGLSHVHRLKTWPRGLRIHPLSPEVCGDRSGRGHRNRRNRLDVRAPLNLASANAFLLSAPSPRGSVIQSCQTAPIPGILGRLLLRAHSGASA